MFNKITALGSRTTATMAVDHNHRSDQRAHTRRDRQTGTVTSINNLIMAMSMVVAMAPGWVRARAGNALPECSRNQISTLMGVGNRASTHFRTRIGHTRLSPRQLAAGARQIRPDTRPTQRAATIAPLTGDHLQNRNQQMTTVLALPSPQRFNLRLLLSARIKAI
jgi:hypothetical protein